MIKNNSLVRFLKSIRTRKIFHQKFLVGQPVIFDFTKQNKILSNIDQNDIDGFQSYITNTLKKKGQRLGIGQYGENRTIYRSSLFTADGEPRTIHLGIDLFVPPGTIVFAPIPGRVHSFQDNANFLDYGPTIILEHNLQKKKFYTLYGHLSRNSLRNITVGQKIRGGQKIAQVGKSNVNGNWPSHVHFQIITDMLSQNGDFPGVARLSEKDYYFNICPDPNLILRIKKFSLWE